LGGVRGGFMAPMHALERKEAFHEPAGTPRGFGVRQSSGAFGSGPRAQKRQRTAAVQDASAPAAGSSRFLVPMHAPKRMEAFHEPQRRAGILPACVGNADETERLALARSPGRLDPSSVAELRRVEACPT